MMPSTPQLDRQPDVARIEHALQRPACLSTSPRIRRERLPVVPVRLVLRAPRRDTIGGAAAAIEVFEVRHAVLHDGADEVADDPARMGRAVP